MINELILWGALGVLIALLALAVWAGRRGLHAIGMSRPPAHIRRQENQMGELIEELRRLNGALEKMVGQQASQNRSDDER